MSDTRTDSVRSGNKDYVTWSVRLSRDAANGYDKFCQANGLTRAGFFEAGGEPSLGERASPEATVGLRLVVVDAMDG